MYKHILVATDGSDLAAKGVEHALAMAAALQAKVTVLTVAEPMDQRAVHAAEAAGVHDVVMRYDDSIAREMKTKFDAARKLAEEHGVNVETTSLELASEIDDSPADAIVRHANIFGCDLIVMTSHGRTGVRKLLLGSQTAQVLAHTTIPVLVIR